MSKAIIFLLVLLISIMPSVVAAATGRPPVAVWNYYHFDGTAFKPGPSTDGTAFIAVRENTRPVILATPGTQISQTVLPTGNGVIAGICYLQSAGGKLGTGGSFVPYPRAPLLISTEGREFVTVQTDDHGYFMVVLPAGTYAIGSGPFTAEIVVERGVTTLVPLRAGKRMVD